MIGFIITILGLILIIVSMYYMQKKEMRMLMEAHTAEILEQRADAIKQSKSVTRGQVSEHMIPLFPDFPYSMTECKFSGQPIDYIIFKGMNSVRDSKEAIVEIIIADVKVGSAQRSKVQNAIKKAIEEGRVRWETWRIDENNKITIK